VEKVKIAMVGPLGLYEKSPKGPASFQRDLVEAIAQLDELKDSPFALSLISERPAKGKKPCTEWHPANVEIEETWTSKNFVFSIPLKLRQLKPSLITASYDPFLYGDTAFHAFAFVFMLALSKLLNRKARLIVAMASLHAGMIPKEWAEQTPFPTPIALVNMGTRLIYKSIVRIADAIMVGKEEQREILLQHYKVKDKAIYLLPHGVPSPKLDIGRNEARRQLSLEEDAYIILNFGYLSHYKGLEELLEAFFQHLKTDKKAVLLIVGGLHPRLYRNTRYQKWVAGLKQYAEENESSAKRAIFTGFVPDMDLPIYFAAADIAVLPYKSHIASGSGALQFAISYEMPTLTTKPAAEHPLLNDSVLMLDSPEPHLLASKMSQILVDDETKDKIKQIVKQIKQERLWSNIASQVIEAYRAELAKQGES